VIWPHAFPLQLVPLKLQITTLLEVPLTTAVNCACPPSGTCTVVGARETDTEARVAVGKTEIASKNHATLNNRSISFCAVLVETFIQPWDKPSENIGVARRQ